MVSEMLFRRKKQLIQESIDHQKEIQTLKARETKRINKATKPMQELNNLLEANGITLEIKKAIGGRHG